MIHTPALLYLSSAGVIFFPIMSKPIETDAVETLAAWKLFQETSDLMPLVRCSVKLERERNTLLEEKQKQLKQNEQNTQIS